MKRALHFTTLITVFTLSLLASAVSAQSDNAPSPPGGTKEFGEYVVHYSTFASLFVPADIAKAHGLVRAKDLSLLNIAVQKKADGEPVAAQVTGTAKNLMQQVKSIEFKTIDEPDAIYYIGGIRHTNEETLHLDLAILPEGEAKPLQFRLTRKLYTEQ